MNYRHCIKCTDIHEEKILWSKSFDVMFLKSDEIQPLTVVGFNFVKEIGLFCLNHDGATIFIRSDLIFFRDRLYTT